MNRGEPMVEIPSGWVMNPAAQTPEEWFASIIKLSGNGWFVPGESRWCPSRQAAWGRFRHSRQYSVAQLEEGAIAEFQHLARAYLDDNERSLVEHKFLGWLMLMQHHHAPTRLLDWTYSPWVALYHCARNDSAHTGYIWAFDQRAFSRLYANDMESWINRLLEVPERMEYIEFLETINQEVLVPLSMIRATRRMIAQQGVYTFAAPADADHAVLIGKIGPNINNIVIQLPASLKPEVLDLLRTMNIMGATLFPGLDGIGLGITEKMRSACGQ